MSRVSRLAALFPQAVAAAVLLTALQAGAADKAPKKGNAAAGKAIFDVRCGICHSTEAAGGPIVGPTLYGRLLNRKAGAVPEFKMYTPALQGSGLKWDLVTLDSFLAAPMNKVPGTAMPMMLPDPTERSDVIAFLVSLKK